MSNDGIITRSTPPIEGFLLLVGRAVHPSQSIVDYYLIDDRYDQAYPRML